MSGATDTQRAIVVRGLRKSFGANAVLRGVDLEVEAGEVFALLGRNGAGKTTTVNILTTLIPPDGGTAAVAGADVVREPRRVRERIALTGQFASVDEFQTGEENLRMVARLAHLPGGQVQARTHELLERFDLTAAARRRVVTYSGGMRRRLDLAMSLVSRPEVLVLDEPTTGLDLHSRSQLWQEVRSVAAEGTTVLLTTQYLDEADRLADRIAVLHDGVVAGLGTPTELKALVASDHVRVVLADVASFAAVQRLYPQGDADDAALTVTVPAGEPVATLREVLAHADRGGLALSAVTVVQPTLDDVFVALTSTGALR